ncbi:MAG: adenylate/guanylate cyclase domain-containing protein [Candidatus Binataceae bacterium]
MDEERWRELLTEGHKPLHLLQVFFRSLPAPPRCKTCYAPFRGLGGKLVALAGFAPSRKNPNFCARCYEGLGQGGAEIDIAVLFADVRGSTRMGEQLEPAAFAKVLDRFYRAVTDVLVRHDAIIDKLIGDEVMALFIPGVCGPQYCQRAAEAAVALMRAVGYGPSKEPWMPIGAAVNSGLSFVGNVGGESISDFTALGDPVNTASRLASKAAAGEVLLSEPIYATAAGRLPNLERRTLALQGKEAPFTVRVCLPAQLNS